MATATKQNITITFIALLLSLASIGQPVITSFSPQSGPVGTIVTITGTNFSSTAAQNVVYFGATRATVNTASTTSLTVTVPAGATYKPLTVTVANLTAYASNPFTVTFPGASPSFTTGSFEYANYVDSVDAGIETTKYIIGDIDNDGKIDVIVIDRLANSLSVYRNTSTGSAVSFADKVDFVTGTNPRALSAGDIDGDGKLDIIVSNLGANTVSVYRNTSSVGTITLAPKLDFATAAQPSVISIADMDKDGRSDLVVNTINLEGYVSILRNTSIGSAISFAPKTDIQSFGGSVEEINTTDIDADGKVDILVPNFFLDAISIFRNTSTSGNISFAPKTEVGTGDGPSSIETADLNADGKPEIVIGYLISSESISLYQNTGSIGNLSFSRNDFATGDFVNGIAIDDLDGDGKPDVAVCGNFQDVSLFRNTSTTAGTISFNPIVKFGTGGTDPILTGDFDSDGKSDIIVRRGVFRATIWKNKATEPQIVSFSPSIGFNGATVTITGVNLGGVTSVSFGGVAASSFTIVNPTTITAIVGSGASGTVIVAAPYGTGRKDGFIYYPTPVITSFTPTSAGNGQTVTITGTAFTGTTSVTFGGVPAASFTVENDNTISAVLANGSSGNVDVTTPGGTATLPGFVFTGPTISSFTPTAGGVGTVVTITGTNFTGATGVSFGGVAATSYTVVNATTITAVVGAGASGSVTVFTPFGSASSSGFLYIAPVITSFTPASANAGATVTITGINLTGATSVSFGGTPAASFTIVNSTTITAVLAAGSSGNVVVTTPFGTATQTGFVYTGPPVINSFTPASAGQGATVVINGAHFTGTTSVTLGGIPVASFTVVSYNVIHAVVATGATGSISVATANGSASVPGFTFLPLPTITSFSPQSGPIGTVVTITGTNFNTSTSDNTVYFGAVKAVVTNATATSLTVTVPAGATYEPISVLNNTLTAYSNKPFIVTFANNGHTGFGPGSFAPKADFTVDAGLRDLGISDLDGDGRPDVAVINHAALGMSVIRNLSTSGNLAFSAQNDFASGFQNYGIFIKDLDGDAKPEVLVGGLTYLSVFRNNSTPGNFSFINSNLSVGGDPMHMYAEDLDGDGKPDVVTANYYAESVSVLRNTSVTGTISFTNLPINLNGPRALHVVVKDIDGDNKADIIVSNNANKILVYRNTSAIGTMSFAAPVSFDTDLEPAALAAGDLDGDGKVDIVTGNYLAANSTVLRNTSSAGNISFSVSNFNSNVGSPTSVAIGDINGDGKPDMAIGNSAFSNVYENTSVNGTISFAPKVAYVLGANSINTAIGDLDGDGRADLASEYSLNGQYATVLRNKVGELGVLSFSPSTGTNGTSITITGLGFANVTGVSFGGTPATSFTINSPTSITAVVGTGASGSVGVTSPAGTASAPGFIYILPVPAITSFSPASAMSGATVNITGSNLTGASAVSFGGVAATSFTVISSSGITAVVGAGASGNVSVTTPGGTASLAGFVYNFPTNVGGPANNNTPSLIIQPNPATDRILIRHPAAIRNTSLRIVDMLGREVRTVLALKNTRQTESTIKGLSPGVYQVIWTDGYEMLSRTLLVN